MSMNYLTRLPCFFHLNQLRLRSAASKMSRLARNEEYCQKHQSTLLWLIYLCVRLNSVISYKEKHRFTSYTIYSLFKAVTSWKESICCTFWCWVVILMATVVYITMFFLYVLVCSSGSFFLDGETWEFPFPQLHFPRSILPWDCPTQKCKLGRVFKKKPAAIA